MLPKTGLVGSQSMLGKERLEDLNLAFCKVVMNIGMCATFLFLLDV